MDGVEPSCMAGNVPLLESHAEMPSREAVGCNGGELLMGRPVSKAYKGRENIFGCKVA